jgi:hypothetical protein
MSKNTFSLNQLTEGIRQRHLGSQNRRLVEKWSRTGLLRGLDGVHRENMACMLENQASQLLRETNTLGNTGQAMTDAGKVRGFSNVAFPIVRRVFGGLIANDLVSIQPMSLPSGLLFYLDYTYGTSQGGVADKTDSIYNDPAGAGVQSGSLGTGGQYGLAGTDYSRVHQTSMAASTISIGSDTNTVICGAHNSAGTFTLTDQALTTSGKNGRLIGYDPDLSNRIDEDGESWQVVFVPLDTALSNVDVTAVKAMSLTGVATNLAAIPAGMQSGTAFNLRRLNEIGNWDGTSFTPNALLARGSTKTPTDGEACLKCVVKLTVAATTAVADGDDGEVGLVFETVRAAKLDVDGDKGDTLVIPAFEADTADGGADMPEIDIKIESLAVTAQSRKLKAKWSPELAQDLNAYHSLDAEVELTQILSEQIALEIDREILNDLLTQGNGANLYWSRSPGKFVNKDTGSEISSTSSLTPGPAFTGTVREWYETLTETIIDAANTIHRKTLRGSANFIVVGPDVATILESSVMYRPSYSLDGDGQVGAPMTIGADKAGTLSNRFTVYKDPYFPRNKVLVGYKGGSYLETGYVYAPYVPLIVTPTIFQPDDFSPRKGVMTRYGKKMVRSDFYGTVTIMDMNVI